MMPDIMCKSDHIQNVIRVPVGNDFIKSTLTVSFEGAEKRIKMETIAKHLIIGGQFIKEKLYGSRGEKTGANL